MLARRSIARPQILRLSQQCARPQRSFSTIELDNGIKMAFDIHSPPAGKDKSGDPIIFLHGFMGSKMNNRSVSKVFARELNRPVYALDLRNHGDSSHDPTHNYTAMAEDVELFIGQQGLHNPTLIGHSMGAKTAMVVALRKRIPISALIPVDNAPVDAALKTDFANYVQGMRKIEEARVQKQSEADEILEPFEKSLPIRQFLLTNLIRSKDGVQKFRVPLKILTDSLASMGDFPFNDPDKMRFEGPTLMVRGTKSPYVADEMLPLVGRFFPRFELVDIEAGHWVISEKPEDFRRAVVDFLSERD